MASYLRLVLCAFFNVDFNIDLEDIEKYQTEQMQELNKIEELRSKYNELELKIASHSFLVSFVK